MIRLPIFFALLFLGLYLNAQQDDCSNLTPNWKSEKEAITKIEKSSFTMSEYVTPENSSWMQSAHYYSCDELNGYLIVKGKETTFVHQDVPKNVWNDLKNARSIGGFYNFYIKDKFRFSKEDLESPVL